MRNKEKQDILVKMILIKRHRTPIYCKTSVTGTPFLNKEFEPMVKKISKQLHCPNINTTLGHEGTLIYSHGKFSRAPALSWKVIDTIGAGDAVLALTSPLTFLDVDPEIVAFIGNCAGALAVQYLGNKETIDYGDLTKLIQSFLK